MLKIYKHRFSQALNRTTQYIWSKPDCHRKMLRLKTDEAIEKLRSKMPEA
jgi:hypothetical protein